MSEKSLEQMNKVFVCGVIEPTEDAIISKFCFAVDTTAPDNLVKLYNPVSDDWKDTKVSMFNGKDSNYIGEHQYAFNAERIAKEIFERFATEQSAIRVEGGQPFGFSSFDKSRREHFRYYVRRISAEYAKCQFIEGERIAGLQ